MRVLIIDDDERVRQALQETLEERDGWKVQGQGFQNLPQALAEYRPDAVVLDLVEGDVTEDDDIAGNQSFGEIRSNWFCPVIVYSEHQGLEDFSHAFVEIIPKGRGSDLAVLKSLQRFTAVAQVIGGVHRDFDKRIRQALHDSVPKLHAQLGTAGDQADGATVLPRAVRRLVAARMDADAAGDGRLKAWERFVIPPLGGHLYSADLLRREDADWTDPEAFRLVLTPSCDLVRHGGEDPKATRVLVAQCEPLTELGNVKVSAVTRLSNKNKNKVKSMLTEGVVDGLLPIPRFAGHVPSMAANLKRLALIEWDSIQLEEREVPATEETAVAGLAELAVADEPEAPEPPAVADEPVAADGAAPVDEPIYVRAASTDSPFRELVVWAYLRVTGRPGAPVFDVDGWLDDILETQAGAGNREGD